MNPLVASACVPGFPITSLFCETPDEAISKTDVLGQVLDEAVKRPSQVVYSVAPSEMLIVSRSKEKYDHETSYGCKTTGSGSR